MVRIMKPLFPAVEWQGDPIRNMRVSTVNQSGCMVHSLPFLTSLTCTEASPRS